MQQIALTKGKIAFIDNEDYDFLMNWTWHYTKAGASTKIGHYKYRHTLLMHRLIMNANDIEQVDHVDNNRLNNQKYNLRKCTLQQNQFNKPKRENVSSIFKGVSYCKQTGKWRAVIEHNSKTIHLGRFINEIEAAIAYDEKAKELFGEFAYINLR